MNVHVAGAADAGALDAYVRAHPSGSIFHLSAWREMVADVAPHDSQVLVSRDERGALRGMLPLHLVESLLGGRTLVSIPYAVYGGVLADDPAAAAALIDAAIRLADELDVRHLELRHRAAHAGATRPLATTDLYVTFVRDLPSDPAACLEAIPRKSRATTRHARDKHGMRFVEGPHLLPRFCELFLDNKTELGSPSFSSRFFENLLLRFGDEVWVSGVEMGGEVIAAVVSFAFGDTLNPYYSGSRSGTERLGSMNFMYWQLMERAVERGFRRYDFGRSRIDTGAFTFKKNMGFEPTPLAYQFYLRGEAALPTLNPSNPKYERFQRLWRRLPKPVLRVMGPWMMRHLP